MLTLTSNTMARPFPPPRTVRFKLLGPVGLVSDDRVTPMAGARQRTLLAVLVINSGETITRDQFIDELWGEDIPSRADNALQALVARLRRLLKQSCNTDAGASEIITRPGGYRLDCGSETTDIAVFHSLVAQAQFSMHTDPLHSRDLLIQALALWEGHALQGVLGGPICRSAALQYEESRLTAMELEVESEMAVGNTSRAISELKRMTLLYPWRERVIEMLMVSLYRVGRQAEAMDTYAKARTRLIDDLGVEPSPLLQESLRAILNQDPTLIGAR